MLWRNRSRTKLAGLLLAVHLAPGCTPAADRPAAGAAPLPHLLTAASTSRVGGEALYQGRLQASGTCLTVVSQGRTAVPIFDSAVTLSGNGSSIVDGRTGETVGIGESIRASAAYLRDEGKA